MYPATNETHANLSGSSLPEKIQSPFGPDELTGQPPDKSVLSWLELHKATRYQWHTSNSGQTTLDVNGHSYILAALDNGDVLAAYFAPRMGRRSYRFFKPGEYREQTEQSLRRLACE